METKRVKLFDLSETVQVVCIKVFENDKNAIDFQIYTEAHSANIQFSWKAEFKSRKERDKSFDNIKPAGIACIYNHVVTDNEMPLKLINIENATDE